MTRVSADVTGNGSRVHNIGLDAMRDASATDRWLSVRADPNRSQLSLVNFVRNLRKRAKWTSALKIQAVVLIRVFGSVSFAWAANACYALGNIFSGKPSRDQSRSELIVANAMWATITFCIVMLAARLPRMLSLRFLNAPDSKPTLWLCLKKLVRGSFVYFVGTLVVMLVCSSFVAYLSVIKPSIFKYKLDCYAGTFSTHGFFTGVTLATKRIFYRETCQGRERLLLSELNPKRTAKRLPIGARPKAALSFRSAYAKRSVKFWRAYIKESPKSAPAALAGAFVHILSQQRIVEQTGTVFTCFVLASTAFKLAIQECIKHYIIKKRIRSIKFMCAAVALPTVLIDTQTRIILLGTKNTRLVTMGTLGMAVAEICFRTVKAILVMRTIRRREDKIFELKNSQMTSFPQQPRTCSLSPIRADFEMWRRRLHAFHIAEINADTYAEYIAIGCSASILFFFGEHPHYSLLRQSGTLGDRNHRLIQLKLLLIQVIVEVIVDFVSTLLEMAADIEYDLIKNLGPFLMFLFIVTAVLNINISVGIYLY